MRPTSRLVAVSLALIFASGSAAAERELPAGGYVTLEGAEARLALAGNLFRIKVRDVVRSDGSKATVYRDVDYPVRTVEAPATPPAKPAPPTATDEEDGGEGDDGEPVAAEEKPAPTFKVQVWFGPEYEDPPAANTSPSPNRTRRAGPTLVVYEFDAYAETEGKDDEYLRVVFDFSGTHPVIRQGMWRMEAEAGKLASVNDAACDFICEQGAYGMTYGRIITPNLHEGIPDTLELSLVRATTDEFGTVDDRDSNLREGEGVGIYTLKRVPTTDEDQRPYW